MKEGGKRERTEERTEERIGERIGERKSDRQREREKFEFEFARRKAILNQFTIATVQRNQRISDKMFAPNFHVIHVLCQKTKRFRTRTLSSLTWSIRHVQTENYFTPIQNKRKISSHMLEEDSKHLPSPVTQLPLLHSQILVDLTSSIESE